MKQTAVKLIVEFCEKQKNNDVSSHRGAYLTIIKFCEEQAEEMEKQQQGYSEEDIINALHSLELKDNKNYSKIYNGMKEWFEQNKNK